MQKRPMWVITNVSDDTKANVIGQGVVETAAQGVHFPTKRERLQVAATLRGRFAVVDRDGAELLRGSCTADTAEHANQILMASVRIDPAAYRVVYKRAEKVNVCG